MGEQTKRLLPMNEEKNRRLDSKRKVRYRGPGLAGLRSGMIGRVAELRPKGAVIDFGSYGTWCVPQYFLAPNV